MSVKIQNIKDRKIYEIDKEAKLYYHLLNPLEQKRLLLANIHNGKITQERIFDMAYDFMSLMVVGWNGFINEEDDKPIIFKKDIIRTIPLEIAIDFVTEIVIPSFKGLIQSAANVIPKDEKGNLIKIKESTSGN